MLPKLLTSISVAETTVWLKQYRQVVAQVKRAGGTFEALDDAALQAKTGEFRSALPLASH